jgi:hypothetical protein
MINQSSHHLPLQLKKLGKIHISQDLLLLLRLLKQVMDFLSQDHHQIHQSQISLEIKGLLFRVQNQVCGVRLHLKPKLQWLIG